MHCCHKIAPFILNMLYCMLRINTHTRRKSKKTFFPFCFWIHTKSENWKKNQNYLSLEGALLYSKDVDFFAFLSIDFGDQN